MNTCKLLLLLYACCTLVVHRPLTTVLHLVLFCAMRTRSCHLYPSISISAIKSLLQVFLGLPLPHFPWGFHCRACLAMLCFGFISVCPIHLHFLLFNSSSTGGWLVFSQSSLLEIFSGHLKLKMCLRQLLMNIWSLCRRLLVVFQVSAPYKRMVFTLELNNQTLVCNEIFLAFQIDPIFQGK